MAVEPEKRPAASPEDIRRYQANLDDEIDGIAVYQLLAEAEQDEDRRATFEELASIEQRHANIWRDKLREAGLQPREHGPSLKVRVVGWLARRFGVESVLPIVRGLEAGAYSTYMAQDATARAIAPDEREHGRALDKIMRGKRRPSEVITHRETWHRTGGGGMLRASVFGVSDGLVSNTALIMGFAGASTGGEVVLLAGVAGLLAGAFSMGTGEYVSMRAQRELFERQIALETSEIEAAPDEERRELKLIYMGKGLSEDEASEMADRLMENPEAALDAMVREELGLDPSELGSPWGASIGSFLAFAGGALVPVIPFFFGADASLPFVAASAGLAAVAMFAVGAALSLFTGRHLLVSAGRQVALGAAAAALTFGIGALVGVSAGV